MVKHNLNSSKLVVALCLTIVLFTLSLFTKPQEVQPIAVETGDGITLQPPAFLKAARAQDAAQVDFDFLLEEAGVTAYTKLNQELDLTNLESRFKTIAQQTDQFISGIVIAPGYEKLTELDESAEIQVFLHSEGWIVAYLSRWQLASAIFDWVSYDKKRLNNSTLVENVVRMLVADVGVSDFNVSYYDFRYPKANSLILVAERVDAEHPDDSFDITVPRGLTVYESSWSSGRFSWTEYGSTCALNDEQLIALNPPESKWGVMTGELTKAKLSQDSMHNLSVKIELGGRVDFTTQSYCGLAIVYQEAAK